MRNLGPLSLSKAKKEIDEFLEDGDDRAFIANFPVYKVIDYMTECLGILWHEMDDNRSGTCVDHWYIYRYSDEEFNEHKLTVQICLYHGDIKLYMGDE